MNGPHRDSARYAETATIGTVIHAEKATDSYIHPEQDSSDRPVARFDWSVAAKGGYITILLPYRKNGSGIKG